jgi:hypothetical protein
VTRDTANDHAFEVLVELWLEAFERGQVGELARDLAFVRGLGQGRIKRIRLPRYGPRGT